MNKLAQVATLSLIACIATYPLPAQTGQTTAGVTAAPHASSQPSAAPSPNTLLDGTPVKLRLAQTISSADAKTGQQVSFEVVEDIKLQGLIVIPKGSAALATVTEADHKKSMGRGGKLNLNIDSVRLADGEKATLRAVEGGKGGGHTGAMTGAIVATSILFFPAAPLFLFIHGKDITLAKGLETTAFVDGDMTVNLAAFAPGSTPGGSLPATTAAALSQLAVDANVANCDIDIDGAFAGNTPSRLSLSAGKHEIAVHKKGYEPWSRSINASGTEIRVYAELSPDAAPTGAVQPQ